MPHLSFMTNKFATSALLTALLMLASCAETPVTQGPSAPATTPQPLLPLPAPEPSSPENQQLAEAQRLLEQRQLLPAASILRELEGSKLSPGEQARLALLSAELQHVKGDDAQALALLGRVDIHSHELPAAIRWGTVQWQLRLTRNVHGPLAAAQFASLSLNQTDDPQQQAILSNSIWQDLNRVAPAALDSASGRAEDGSWRGWLELALAAAQVADSPEVQAAEIEFWQQRYPEHPAALNPPGGIDMLADLESSAPDKVVLLLPLSGGQESQGRAVLDGFMAAQFAGRQQGWPQLEIAALDTAAVGTIDEAYDSAVNAGADIVMGPLTPELLNGWRPAASLPVPLLALEWPDTAAIQAWHMALEPRDEGRQLARLAYERGARRALLVRPEGAWGDSVAESLLEQWEALEGKVGAVAIYSGQTDYSSALKDALNLAASEQRASRMRQIVGQQLEFAPRRRQDLDVIFLLAEDPQDARSIKPLLAFHYAGDLPVYATSHIFSGRIDPSRDRDLNGIHTLALPWHLRDGNDLAQLIQRTDGDPLQSHFHALGADAFRINWRLQQLAADQRNSVRGYTGLLRMDSQGRVYRELVPALIQRGVPEPR